MFNNIDDWQSDAQLEREGVPLDLGRGRVIYLKRAGGANRAFTVALGECLRRVIGDRDPENVPDEELDEDLKTVYATHVVAGWKGFRDESDAEVPYSVPAFLELMKLAPDMWIRVRSMAKMRESFQKMRDAVERDKVTLGKSSRGKRNGGHSAHA
jgi:hypothetical protein